MKTFTSILIVLSVLLFGICSCTSKTTTQQQTTEKKQDGETLAEAYKNGDWDLVVAIGDTLIGTDDPKNISIPYAEALAATGNPQKAIDVLNKKIEKTPGDYYLFETKGNVYYSAEKFDSAIINYDIVISMKPTYARPYINEGQIYEIIGDKNKAIDNYIIAAKLFSENNYIEETVEYCRRVLAIDSANIEAKKLLEQTLN
jgi:tetratricopeptide (TPR) repeat protein